MMPKVYFSADECPPMPPVTALGTKPGSAHISASLPAASIPWANENR
jgi:hypothetical protein